MKKTKIFLACIIVVSMTLSSFVNASADYVEFGKIKREHLTITSFSKQWGDDKLALLYEELCNNFMGDEFLYISDIYLYPDSPYGVLGLYNEDIALTEEGVVFGNKATIELFQMDKRTTLDDVALTLAHEYGHHYTIFNMIHAEHLYYSDWYDSTYAKIRGISGTYTEEQAHAWDITEMAASDYVQLLGSKTAKTSYAYKEAIDRVDETIAQPTKFNKRPQENFSLPLAADVSGLYEYLLAVGGYTHVAPKIDAKPHIAGIQTEQTPFGKQYTISWSGASGKGPFEYTAVMVSDDGLNVVEPLKTIDENTSKGGRLEAKFGIMFEKEKDGKLIGIEEALEGTYTFYVFAKDKNGFMFSSEPFVYTFPK